MPTPQQQPPGRARRFVVQSKALLIRTYHVQRRQHCLNICTLILSPLLLVLFSLLSRLLNTRTIDPLIVQNVIDETNPTFAFAARPFQAGKCLLLADDASSSQTCERDPFQPKPFQVPFALASGVSSTDVGQVEYVQCQNQSVNAPLCNELLNNPNKKTGQGLLNDFSLQPFLYPQLLAENDPCQSATNQYNCIFRHTVLTPSDLSRAAEQLLTESRINQAYQIFRSAESSRVIDNLYETNTRRFSSRQDMINHIFEIWRESNIFGTYNTAYYFKKYQLKEDDSVSIDATVFYNDSATANCTKACGLTSGVTSLSNALFKTIAPDKTATAYLRQFPQIKREDILGFIELAISIFIALFYHFLFPGFLRFLVYERSSRLRDMMQMMGLTPFNYWIATYFGLLAQYGIFAILLMIVGYAVNIQFYRQNAAIAFILLFFLWGNVMVAFAMFLSPFFKHADTALVLGWFYVIVTAFIGGPFLGRLLASDEPESTWFAVQLLPSFAFMRSVYHMGALNTGGKGVTVGDEFFAGENLNMCSTGPLCRSYAFLAIEWLVLLTLGLYLDRVLPGATGVRSHPLFFLGFKRGLAKEQPPESDDTELGSDEDERLNCAGQDAAAEQTQAHELAREENSDAGIVIDKLVKVYHGNPPVRAVNGLSLVARRNQVCGLLGANGAGKSTTFHIITGELERTSGNVFINGKNVRTDMNAIRQDLGLCPQHDRVWNDMSVEEHLRFYGRLRSLSGKTLRRYVNNALESVQLTFARKRRAAKCSGGMRRRLSVAISFIGESSVVCLDEPTTGLDPRSRQKVWECIEARKQDKAIVLTTHSLEEAESLCDRVAIMAHGRLKCIGRPDELKLRLGRGYRLTFSLPATKVPDLHLLMEKLSKDAMFETALASNIVYTLPKSVPLSEIFSEVQKHKESLELHDWAVTESSLEDIFIDITKQEQQSQDRKLQQEV